MVGIDGTLQLELGVPVRTPRFLHWLKTFGFVQTHSDQSVFTLERTMKTPGGPRREQIHVGVYVDDLAIVYSHDDDHSL